MYFREWCWHCGYMSIKPRNDIPIWQTYILITNPLYVEMKDYTHNLIHSGLSIKQSSHTPPLLYVLGKKMSLLGSVKIGGYKWFSFIDQVNTFHQGKFGWKREVYNFISWILWMEANSIWTDRNDTCLPDICEWLSRGTQCSLLPSIS